MDKTIQLPFYAKASLFILGLSAFVSILYITQEILVPFIFAAIIAVVLHPVVIVFVRLGINRIIAITITLFLTFLIIAAFSGLLISQAIQFSDSWPLLVDKSTAVLNQTISWTSDYFDITPRVIHKWITATKAELLTNSSSAIGQTLISVGGWVAVLCLVPFYVFLFLFYQPLLIEFIHRLFGSSDQNQVKEIVSQTKSVIQHYLVGLVIEAVIVSVLNTAGLLILGIDYAILLGIIGALLNVIPYIGGIVAVALPMMVALATKSSAWYAIYVLALYIIIQLIDNNYIVPIIVAAKVKINALFSIAVVIAGNALWGVSGMFLSIPLLAIIKLIFDHIEPLKPWGFLLGDTMPTFLKVRPFFRKNKK